MSAIKGRYTLIFRNIIQDYGLLTGLMLKWVQVFDSDGRRILSLPLYPVKFDRKLGLEMRDVDIKFRALKNKLEKK